VSVERVFFSEEKNQKTFISCNGSKIRDPAGIVEPAVEIKVFCFRPGGLRTFFKKEDLPS